MDADNDYVAARCQLFSNYMNVVSYRSVRDLHWELDISKVWHGISQSLRITGSYWAQQLRQRF